MKETHLAYFESVFQAIKGLYFIQINIRSCCFLRESHILPLYIFKDNMEFP